MIIRFKWNGRHYAMTEEELEEFLYHRTMYFPGVAGYKNHVLVSWVHETRSIETEFKYKKIKDDLVEIGEDLLDLYKEMMERLIKELEDEIQTVMEEAR